MSATGNTYTCERCGREYAHEGTAFVDGGWQGKGVPPKPAIVVCLDCYREVEAGV